jgi:hypothetical protein
MTIAVYWVMTAYNLVGSLVFNLLSYFRNFVAHRTGFGGMWNDRETAFF